MRFRAKLNSLTWFLFAITPVIMFLFTEKTLQDFVLWFYEGWAIPSFLLQLQTLLSLNGITIPLPIIYYAWYVICIELTILIVEVITFIPNLTMRLTNRWVRGEGK